MATQAQKRGSVKDIQAHLRHSRPDTTANEYMQELPESVQAMVGSVYAVLTKGGEKTSSDDLPQKAANDESAVPAKLLMTDLRHRRHVVPDTWVTLSPGRT
jgi:hypothetical protein